MKAFHEVLAPLLAGFTVTKVEAGDGREGDPAKITCTRGGVTRTFEVWSGIDGPCVSHVKESKGDSPEVWTSVVGMFEAITDHVLEITHGEYGEDLTLIEPVEHPQTLRLGFRCTRTLTEWWTNLVHIKDSPFTAKFSTAEGRKVLAESLSRCGHGLYSFDSK